MVNICVDCLTGKYSLEQLLEIMRMLRAPDGCPWDREQTHASIRNNFLEEAYEAVDAIDRDNTADMCEELGDVLMQVVFHSIMAEEENRFCFSDIVDGVSKKLIYRHPHVFGDVKADTAEKVLDNWDKLKRVEKSQSTYTDTLRSVPAAFPALLRAQKVQKRASKAGYDFDSAMSALSKIKEETGELSEILPSSDKERITEELGDLLFSVVNTGRLLGIDCEEALGRATSKFTDRFEKAENQILADGFDMKELSADKLDEYWNKAKND